VPQLALGCLAFQFRFEEHRLKLLVMLRQVLEPVCNLCQRVLRVTNEGMQLAVLALKPGQLLLQFHARCVRLHQHLLLLPQLIVHRLRDHTQLFHQVLQVDDAAYATLTGKFMLGQFLDHLSLLNDGC
jgi:hypothetical protein